MPKRHRSAVSGYSSSDDHSDVLPIVQGMSRMSLDDDGDRNWWEQAITMLNNDYPDWKDLKSSYMVPPCFHLSKPNDPGQLSEKHIYDLLEKFGQEYKEPMFVVHSADFKELCDFIRSGELVTEWIIGEHDFVIIHKLYGLIFLQVKAKKKNKMSLKTIKEARAQIDKDLMSLRSFLKKKFESTTKKRQGFGLFNYPGFVVLPNFKGEAKLRDQYSDVLFEADCCSLKSFRSWWDEKVVKPHKLINPEVFEELLIRFVALRHCNPPLSRKFDKQISMFYTREQLNVMLESPPEHWITGPAGSGKTFLLIEKVLNLEKRKNERILVLVFNKPLQIYLSERFKEIRNIEIMTYVQFLCKKGIIPQGMFFEREYDYKEKCKVIESSYKQLKSNPSVIQGKYEHIFVDEGQDFFSVHWPELLKLFHNKPCTKDNVRSFKKFYFWVMFDSNQYVQPGLRNLPVSHLQNASRLTQVLRNTGNVFSLSKKYFNSFDEESNEIKLGHNINGVNILWVNELQESERNCSSLVNKQIKELRNKEVNDGDIAILTKNKTISSKLSKELRTDYNVQSMNAEYHRQRNQVTVDSVRRFKGLESKVVILVDPDYELKPHHGSLEKELMYVAVSRCLCYLIIISTRSGCEYLQSDAGLRNVENWMEDEEDDEDNIPSYQLDARFNYDN